MAATTQIETLSWTLSPEEASTYEIVVDLDDSPAGGALIIKRIFTQQRNPQSRYSGSDTPGALWRLVVLRCRSAALREEMLYQHEDDRSSLIGLPPFLRERMIQGVLQSHMNTINGMSTGQRPDFMAAARRAAYEGRQAAT